MKKCKTSARIQRQLKYHREAILGLMKELNALKAKVKRDSDEWLWAVTIR